MIRLTDDLGRTVILKNPPARIVSLVPSITLSLYDLGAGDRVAGRTSFCIHPKAAVQQAMVVGGTKKVHLDKVLSLRPDLVLANKEENVEEQITELSRQVPVFVTDIHTYADNARLLDILGRLTGKTTAAKDWNARIQAAYKDATRKLKSHAPLRALYVIWRKPYMSVGADTFIHDIMDRAGFVHVMGHKRRYPKFSAAEAQALSPDVVFLSSEPYPFREKHIAEFSAMLPGAAIRLVDGEMFSWYGTRLLETWGYLLELRRELDGG